MEVWLTSNRANPVAGTVRVRLVSIASGEAALDLTMDEEIEPDASRCVCALTTAQVEVGWTGVQSGRGI